MIELFFAKLQEILAEGKDVRLSILRGTVRSTGSREAVRITASDKGLIVNVNLVCEETYVFKGQTRNNHYYASVSAFGGVAERLAELQEGDRVIVLTKRDRKKYKDKYYENDTVLFVEKL